MKAVLSRFKEWSAKEVGSHTGTSDDRSKKRPIVMTTCYDAWSAKLVGQSPIDAVLVGDSGAMIQLGHSSTLNAELHHMVEWVKSVAPFLSAEQSLIGDMPFLKHRMGLRVAMEAAKALIQAGAQAVKIEGPEIRIIRHMVESGIPVMGHLGLTPQSVLTLGGYRVQAKSQSDQDVLLKAALDLESAGVFSIVLECVPADFAHEVQKNLKIPVIGIGAGSAVAGQVLVLHDLLGLSTDPVPKFVRCFADGSSLVSEALKKYVDAVQRREFPSVKEEYS